MFIERLKDYREKTLNISTRKEMSDKLNISEQLYAMVERGDRNPSKNFLDKLVAFSSLPEEYWLYGITNESERLNVRKDFKSIETTILDLIDEGYITNTDFNDEIKEILFTAIKADIQHLLLKKKQR